jgi:trehalose utilization protein
MGEHIRITVWNENRHEQKNAAIAEIYPKGIHGAIAAYLETRGFKTATATLDEPEHGLTDKVIESTDVLIWWGHIAHHEVADAIVDKLHQRVLSGMGLIALHSAHYSKIFRRLMGTNCSLKFREAAEKERLYNIAPAHEITQGIGDYIELAHTEMYGERFDIPEPDKLIFISWFKGGEVFRSGCVWERGNGRIFYFKPGHESHAIYHNAAILRVIENAARWACRRVDMPTHKCACITEPLEKI